MDVNEYIKRLETEFKKRANDKIAAGQKAYMKNNFEFYGLKTPVRHEIQKPFLVKEHLPPKSEMEKIVKTLWEKPEREYQYFAQEMAFKYAKRFNENDINLFEFMIVNKSWWDTVDFIAPKLIGKYFKVFSGQRDKRVKKWISSGNIWLQRSSLLFQLNYKEKLDTELLEYIINSLVGSEEFFVNKAIGWILRQYSKINPEWVIEFTKRTKLDKLSYKEALRLINGDKIFREGSPS